MDARNINGATGNRGAADNEFYATPIYATKALLEELKKEGFGPRKVLEPAAGQGHISKAVKEVFSKAEVTSTDLIGREDRFNMCLHGGVDFLLTDFQDDYDLVITNPPFRHMKEFVEKALEVTKDKAVIFGKIQFLEGQKRQGFHRESPLKYIYVFSSRVSTLRNGVETDENGKPWQTVFCHAWFVYEKGYKGEPVVRWL